MSKYNVNQIIEGKVNSIKPYGIFVIIDDIYTGLIHISQINGKFINDINDYFKVGDVIKVRVIDVDEEETKEEKTEEVVGEKKEISDPRTGDNVTIYAAIGFISFISILAIVKKIKRN